MSPVLDLFPNPLKNANSHTQRAYGLLDGDTYTLNPAHCQRVLCWTNEQYESFIKNVLTTGNFGEVIIVRDTTTGKDYVVDGQHRLEALKRFFEGELSVTADNKVVNFIELSVQDKTDIKSHIKGTVRSFSTSSYDSMLSEVEALYTMFNYSGVKHYALYNN